MSESTHTYFARKITDPERDGYGFYTVLDVDGVPVAPCNLPGHLSQVEHGGFVNQTVITRGEAVRSGLHIENDPFADVVAEPIRGGRLCRLYRAGEPVRDSFGDVMTMDGLDAAQMGIPVFGSE